MHLTAILPRMASGVYYSVWPKLRPSGYLGRVTAIFRSRAGLEWDPGYDRFLVPFLTHPRR